ncbi:hypothetical protein GALL_509550 [mine drainage metagenome]|uniref:Uncharacterized protein n=1 Tax=mine drainage metagenome TaxID=410659 RepID=A0A1J5P8C8_9ZZZZ
MGVDQVHRLLQGLDPHHAEHRAEDFFLVGDHAGLDVVKQAGSQKITRLMAGNTYATAIHHQRGTFFNALIDIALDLLEMRLGHQRAHVAGSVGAGADLHLGNLGFQSGHNRIGGGITHCHHQRNGHAALAAGTIGRTHQGADRVADVGIGHDHGVVLGTAERLHPLAVGAAGGVDVFGNGSGADKTDGADARVGE